MITTKANPNACPCCKAPLSNTERLELPVFSLISLVCNECESFSILVLQDSLDSLLVLRAPSEADDDVFNAQFPKIVEGQTQTLLDDAMDNPFFKYYFQQLLSNAVPLMPADGDWGYYKAQAFLNTYGDELSQEAVDEHGVDTYLSCPLTGSYMFAKQNDQGGFDHVETFITNDYFESETPELVAIRLMDWSLCECDYVGVLSRTKAVKVSKA